MKDTQQEVELKRKEQQPTGCGNCNTSDDNNGLTKRQRLGAESAVDDHEASAKLPDATDEIRDRRIEALRSCRYSASTSIEAVSQERLMALLWNVAAIEPK